MRSSMIRWNPAVPFFTGREPLFNLFENILNTEVAPSEELTNRAWMPPVDIRETPEAFLVTAELPGLTREELQITLENNVLRLTGERKFEKEGENYTYHRMERPYGVFTRSFALPVQVEADRVEALFQDGVLTVTVPKAEKARPRKIDIQ